ncbi:hypothetical protein [Acinetobacter ursingii]|uniref:hypothetical protein n=1 Tax=Acinetobacter ursingii TaxID=108980 RepID=UPI00148F0F54|nr:hypothetical protein [Acinetobacter ursingii]
MIIKPKQVLVWKNGKPEVKTLPFSKGGRVGRTTRNTQEANDLYKRLNKEKTQVVDHE